MSAKNDSEFLRLAVMILGALVAFTVLIIIAANMVFDSSGIGYGSAEAEAERAWKDIQPVGAVSVTGAKTADAAPAAAPKSGAEVYASSCLACHGSGVAGAPKVGDTAAWNARMANGMDAIVQTAINGKGAMPPKGGNAALSDAEVKAAVEHMLSESGVAAPAASAQAAAPEAASVVSSSGAAVEDTAGEAVQSAAAGPDLAKGQQIYQTACFACHGTGVAGAPRLGDKANWAPRIAAGMDSMMQVAVNGKGAMPPKGGHMNLSNDDIAAVVAYMVNQSQ